MSASPHKTFTSSSNSTRLILCFFSASDLKLHQPPRFSGLPSSTSCLVGTDDRSKSFARHYASLRLDNECLLAIQAQPNDVLPTVEALRAAGYPSIFVLRDKPVDLGAEDLAATDPEPNMETLRPANPAFEIHRRRF